MKTRKTVLEGLQKNAKRPAEPSNVPSKTSEPAAKKKKETPAQLKRKLLELTKQLGEKGDADEEEDDNADEEEDEEDESDA